jgi:TRAP-type C4-dicarboxylate transport system permease small subunit
MLNTTLGCITDSLDITELFLIFIIFCGLAFLESGNGHIRVDMFVNMFPRILKKIVVFITYMLGAGILFLLTYAMFGDISETLNSGAATQVLHIPHWPFVVVTTVALLLYAVTVLFHGIELLIKKEA